MKIFTGRPAKAGILYNDGPKSPWGGGGSSGGGDNNSGGSGGGPRNPWAFPPEGRRPRTGGASTLDELLKRARRGGGGPGLPGVPGGPQIWLLVAVFLLFIWYGLTGVWQIGAQERGVVTVLGRYAGTLDSGLRFTLPAPFATVQKVDVSAIRYEDFPKGTGENLMLTGDQNIVNLNFRVRWRVVNPQDYVFQINDPDDTVRAVAESSMRAVVATTTLNDTIGSGRGAIALRVQKLMQQILDEYRAGVSIEGVSINNASGPAAVDEDFKRVSAAQQEAQAAQNNARGYAQQVIAQAQGEAAQFDKLYAQYKLAPDVTRRRLYYETMEQVLAKSKKTIVDAPGVLPYLPLPDARRMTEPQNQTQPQTGAAR